MRTIAGRQEFKLDRLTIEQKIVGFPNVLIDLGTGDGRFVYKQAQQPNIFCIGIDAAADRLREVSWRASRKPERGGRSNALFVLSSLESLPDELAGLATRLTCLYPWGSLLRAWIEPSPALIASMLHLARPNACLTVLLNHSIFDDRAYCERLGLPTLTDAYIEGQLLPCWTDLGLHDVTVEKIAGPGSNSTSWGQRLTKGSHRITMRIEARIRPTSDGRS